MASNEHLYSDDSFSVWLQPRVLFQAPDTHLIGISFWVFRMAPQIRSRYIAFTQKLYDILANDVTIYPVSQARNLDAILGSSNSHADI